MSTRANIIIQDRDEKLWFYRHSDGYPKGAMPTLHKFMEWVRTGQIRRNVVQASGWLVLLGAKEYENLAMEPSDANRHDWKCGAYEPTSGRHGDIEYLYELDLATREIRCFKVGYGEEKDTLIFTDTITEPWKAKAS